MRRQRQLNTLWVTGITLAMLTSQLRKLEVNGFVSRKFSPPVWQLPNTASLNSALQHPMMGKVKNGNHIVAFFAVVVTKIIFAD